MFRQAAFTIQLSFLLVLLLFAGCLGGSGKAHAGKLYIDISSPYVRKIPISLVKIRSANGVPSEALAAKRVITRLSKDLLFHGFFSVISFDTGIPGKAPDYEVRGRVESRGSDMVIELRLMDMAADSMITGKRYITAPDDLDRVCHRFCDEIIMAITGEHGVSLSRILFVSRSSRGQEVYSAQFDGLDIRRETNERSIVMSPRYSPDGRYIAFVSFKSGRPCLYLKERASGKVHRLSTHAGLNMSPAWSPDGRRLCVTLSKSGNPDLYLVGLNGRILKRLTRGPGINVSASFSPDGRRIVFVSDRSGSPQLYVMDLSSLKVRRLTYSGSYNTDPQWSPRGDRIVYVSRVSGRFQVCTICPEGGEPVQLTQEGSNENPTWSPDGRQILFSSTRKGGKKSLFVMFADGQGQRLLLDYGASDYFPFWGPNVFK